MILFGLSQINNGVKECQQRRWFDFDCVMWSKSGRNCAWKKIRVQLLVWPSFNRYTRTPTIDRSIESPQDMELCNPGPVRDIHGVQFCLASSACLGLNPPIFHKTRWADDMQLPTSNKNQMKCSFYFACCSLEISNNPFCCHNQRAVRK